jgi:hypothetical protein
MWPRVSANSDGPRLIHDHPIVQFSGSLPVAPKSNGSLIPAEPVVPDAAVSTDFRSPLDSTETGLNHADCFRRPLIVSRGALGLGTFKRIEDSTFRSDSIHTEQSEPESGRNPVP